MFAISFLFRLIRSSDRVSEIALSSLLTSQTYRLPNDASNDPLIGFKLIFRLVKGGAKKEPFFVVGQGGNMIITGKLRSKDQRIRYLNSLGIDIETVLIRSELLGYWRKLNLFKLITYFALGFLLGVFVLFTKRNRVQFSLLTLELIEAEILSDYLRDHPHKIIHDFSQFEIDSNFLYLYLKSHLKHLAYFKYPSPGPLMLHNQKLLADSLCYSSDYQNYELKLLDEVIVKRKQKVPPESYLDYFHHYEGREFSPSFDIGFYSHGGWVRSDAGDAEDGLHIEQKESKLLKVLGGLLERYAQLSLIIFTHPKERSTAYDLLERKYMNFLDGFKDRVSIVSDIETRNTLRFGDAKVGIGVYSTILHERHMMGFPTVFYSPVSWFPVAGSNLESITLQELTGLDDLLINMVNQPLVNRMPEINTHSFKIEIE